MKIRFSKHLDLQEIIFEKKDKSTKNLFETKNPGLAPLEAKAGDVIFTIENPLLTLDSSKLNQNTRGKFVLFNFSQSKPVTVSYTGVENIWIPKVFKNTWPVTIDTIFLTKSLDKYFSKHSEDIDSILDLGSGTGFLGQYFSKKFKTKDVFFSDINNYAVLHSYFNNRNISRNNFFKSDVFEDIKKTKYDLILVNPPYIPNRPQTHTSSESFIYAETKLLELSLQNARYHSTNLFVMNYSDLAKKEFERSLDKNNFELVDKYTLDVPFRVPNVLKDKEWLTYLTSNKLLLPGNSEYDYFHRLNTVILKRK